MAKRQLNEDEKRIISKSLLSINKELEYKERVELARKKFNLEVADLEVEKQKNAIKAEIKLLEREIAEYKRAIEELEQQIKYGVEIKTISKDTQ